MNDELNYYFSTSFPVSFWILMMDSHCNVPSKKHVRLVLFYMGRCVYQITLNPFNHVSFRTFCCGSIDNHKYAKWCSYNNLIYSISLSVLLVNKSIAQLTRKMNQRPQWKMSFWGGLFLRCAWVCMCVCLREREKITREKLFPSSSPCAPFVVVW